ncbi:MAG: SRPBCC domain-containing protein [Anaeromyxobacter sp.]
MPPHEPDRSATTGRRLAAPPARVLAAFTDPARLARWWGPAGFTNTFEVCEPRPGGAWRYTMHGPDGKHYPNEARFVVVAPDEVVVEHLNAPRFVLTLALAPEAGGTRLTWTQTFETAALRDQLLAFVGPANEQNLDRLEAEIARG